MTRVVPRSELPNARPRAERARLEVGMRLGRYELLCPIAEGGMAQVWAAEQTGDLGFRKLIALKTIRPDFAYDAGFRAMFLDEAQLASRIRHGNVVEVQDLGVEGDIVFQAMALVDGVACSEWMRAAKERLPIGVSLRIAIDMLHGLHAAHTLKDDEGHLLGLVHRDVSPQNVLVGSDGVAKLADFGIAKAFGRATEETVAGDVKGKLAYVAPEQLQGLPAGPQSDLYSAGIVLWELLTATRLFPVGNGASEKRVGVTARDPRAVVPSLPKSICEIVMRALRDDPFERYETSLEMADLLEEAARAENIVASHRAVANALEKDLGRKLEATRERLRHAKKRAGATTGPIQPERPAEPTAVVMPQQTALLPMPATRVGALPVPAQELATDTVTIGETPRPMLEPPRRVEKSSGALLPFALTAVLLVALVGAVRVWGPPTQRAARPPPAPLPAPVPIVEPVVTAVAEPPAVVPPPAVAPAPTASTPHRPPLPHGRTRPAPAPAPKPATSPTIAPRFENPY